MKSSSCFSRIHALPLKWPEKLPIALGGRDPSWQSTMKGGAMFRTKGSTQQPTDKGHDATAGREGRPAPRFTDERGTHDDMEESLLPETQATVTLTP